MNIPIFRAKKIDSDEYVKGYLVRADDYDADVDEDQVIYFIMDKMENYRTSEVWDFVQNSRIDPTTLSIHFSDMLDSQGNKVFASLQAEGKGGDLVSMGKGCINRTLVYKYGQFWFTDFSNTQLNSNNFSQVAFNLHFTEKFNFKNRLRNYLNEIEVVGIQR